MNEAASENSPLLSGRDKISGAETAKSSILAHRKQQATLLKRIVDVVESLKVASPDTPWEVLLQWLRQETGATAEEAETYLKFAQVLDSASDVILDRGVSIQVIHSLIKTEARIRSECLERIARGETIDAAFIEDLARAYRLKTTPPIRADFNRRRKRLLEAADDLARSVRVRLEEAAVNLLRLMDDLHERHVYWTDEGAAYDEDDSYRKDVRRIARRAASARKDFEMLFGAAHPDRRGVGELGLTNDVAASFALSWHALRDLGLKRFDPFSFDPEAVSSPIRSAIAYLAGTMPNVAPVTTVRTPPAVPPKTLRVLDISGGTGSSVLGLDTAGFKPLAVYEGDEELREALKENRPDWEVLDFPPAAEFDEEFSSYSTFGIDLITSSRTLTPKAFSRPVGELRPTVPEVERIVKLVRPKAFFFEVDPFVKPNDRKIRPDMDRLGSELGYDLQWCSVSSSRLGLVQSKSRNVDVGLRDGLMDKFSVPVVAETRGKSLVEAIRDQLTALIHLPSGTADDIQWISDWMKNAEGSQAPFFFIDKDNYRPTGWTRKLKIDFALYPPEPKKLSDLKGNSGRLRLSLAMLKRLQGIPDQWKVAPRLVLKNKEAELRTSEVEQTRTRISEVETAVPPILAKLVGLGLYEALTGRKVDIDAALASPLLAPRCVVGRSRFGDNPTLVPAEGVQPASGLRPAPSNFETTPQGRSLAAWKQQRESQLDDPPDERAFTAD